MKAPLQRDTFTPAQWRNIGFYILGIMLYKFGLEWYNGAFITLANERFNSSNRFTNIGILTGTNYAAQAIGSILVAPLIKRYPTRSVLACAILLFALISTIPMIADAATGGQLKFKTANNDEQYGTWNPNGLFPIYVVSGLSYGTVELIRRVIPRDIVGSDVVRLKKMDSLVHVLYEVAGTAGAFSSTALIARFGYNYSSLLTPVFFTFACLAWSFVAPVGEANKRKEAAKLAVLENEMSAKEPLGKAILGAFKAFGKAFYYGGYLVMTDRRFIWLVPGYTLALYGHRYLENGLAPIFARSVIGRSAYSQIIVGGSNFGELLGALTVMCFTTQVPTPMPWLRLDALLLMLVWVMPYFPTTRNNVGSAWRLAATFIPISFGWAAGDVSLAAYIQSTLDKVESRDPDVSSLGAVMSFLYVLYIILYSVISSTLGRFVDSRLRGLTGAATEQPARDVLRMVAGVHFTVLAAVIISSTFIPKGSFSLNPKAIDVIPGAVDEETDGVQRRGTDVSDEDEELKKKNTTPEAERSGELAK